METLIARYRDVLLGLPLILGVLWIFDLPLLIGIAILTPSYLAVIVGLGIAAAFMVHPLRKQAGLLEVVIGLCAISAWFYCAANLEAWLFTPHIRGPEKLVPALVGIILLCEALRRVAGAGIAVLIVLMFTYGIFGQHAPGVFQGTQVPFDRFTIYLYSDTSGILGFVMDVVAGMVMAFVILGQFMKQSGTTHFFNDISMSLFGRHTGGAAKVAVTGSSLMGMINSSTVGNILSTGVITIPLMKRSGFKAHIAAGVEAVASNGSQLAPPVMGATAFLIAEFLEIPYTEVALAALIPALLYYLILFAQVDFYARATRASAIETVDLPVFGDVLKKGWLFLFPIVVLLVLLFWVRHNPAESALIAAAANIVPLLILRRTPLNVGFIRDFLLEGGRSMLPLILIGAASGIVIGTMNLSGLGFNITMSLGQVGEAYGLFPVLIITAFLCIVLGMGMPTAAVYVIVAVLLTPILIKSGVTPIAAHMFVLYFGLASMLTPPVAIASYVAAGIAKTSMWKAGIAGVTLGASSFLLPFMFAYNPALLMQGSWYEIIVSACFATISGLLLAYALCFLGLVKGRGRLHAALPFACSVIIAIAALWFKEQPALAFGAATAGLVYLVYLIRTIGADHPEATVVA
jgi:TRAP transporter 4TM/12TM fusion protein